MSNLVTKENPLIGGERELVIWKLLLFGLAPFGIIHKLNKYSTFIFDHPVFALKYDILILAVIETGLYLPNGEELNSRELLLNNFDALIISLGLLLITLRVAVNTSKTNIPIGLIGTICIYMLLILLTEFILAVGSIFFASALVGGVLLFILHGFTSTKTRCGNCGSAKSGNCPYC